MTDKITIAHLSDAHLPNHGRFHLHELAGKRALSALNWLRKRQYSHRRDIADALRADVVAHGPDHVAMTGDVVNFGLAREFEAGAAWLDGFGPEVSFVPGNHEAIHAGAEAQLAAAFARFTTGDDGVAGRWPWVKRRGLVTLIGVTTSIATAPFLAQGEAGTEQIDALRTVLAETEGTLRVILIHHPPTDITIPRKHLRDRAALAAVIGAAGGAIVLHGHNHKNQLSWIDGPKGRVPVLGTPSASVPVGDSFQPAEWRLLTISESGAGWSVDLVRRSVDLAGEFQDRGRFGLAVARP